MSDEEDKIPTPEERLKEHQAQGGAATKADYDFIEVVRACRISGVGYGFMQQVIEWEWMHKQPGGAWGPAFFEGEIKKRDEEIERLRGLLGRGQTKPQTPAAMKRRKAPR